MLNFQIETGSPAKVIHMDREEMELFLYYELEILMNEFLWVEKYRKGCTRNNSRKKS